ncbi:MAG: PEP-CTERM sorting domain-containing protein [Verrucomicrobia bacterium]|nr:PEP-CTERM sorting domain-containing protein [Verrucomicrobiota bacterium]
MKKVLIALAALVVTTSVFGQGTVVFNNRNPAAGIDAKILLPGGAGVSGAAFTADLIAGPAGTALAKLVPVAGSTTTFRTGAAAGYVNSTTVTIPGIAAGGQATIAVRAYNGSTYAGSSLFGTSAPITIGTGNPTTSPPGTPTDMVGLTGFTLVPEPSTIALAILGIAGLLIRRRK